MTSSKSNGHDSQKLSEEKGKPFAKHKNLL